MGSNKMDLWTDGPPEKVRQHGERSCTSKQAKREAQYRALYNRRRELGIQPRGHRRRRYSDESENEEDNQPLALQMSKTRTYQQSQARRMRQYPAKAPRISSPQKTLGDFGRPAPGLTKTRKKSRKTQCSEDNSLPEDINLPVAAVCTTTTIEPILQLDNEFSEYGKLSLMDTEIPETDVTCLPKPRPAFVCETQHSEPNISTSTTSKYECQINSNAFTFKPKNAGKTSEKILESLWLYRYTTSLEKDETQSATKSANVKEDTQDGDPSSNFPETSLKKEREEFNVDVQEEIQDGEPANNFPETSIKKECKELGQTHTEIDINNTEMSADVENINFETIVVDIKKEPDYTTEFDVPIIQSEEDVLSMVHVDSEIDNLTNNGVASVEIEVLPIISTHEMHIPQWKGVLKNTFDGKQKQSWTKFMKEYRKKIYSIPRLSDVEKYFHLFSHLEGEPKKLCEHLPLQESSLQQAIDILKSKYCRRTVIDINLKRMFELPTVNDEGRVIKDLIDPVLEIREAFKKFCLYWDPMLMQVVLSKVPQHLKDGFEVDFGGLGEEPIFTDLIVYLQQKCRPRIDLYGPKYDHLVPK